MSRFLKCFLWIFVYFWPGSYVASCRLWHAVLLTVTDEAQRGQRTTEGSEDLVSNSHIFPFHISVVWVGSRALVSSLVCNWTFKMFKLILSIATGGWQRYVDWQARPLRIAPADCFRKMWSLRCRVICRNSIQFFMLQYLVLPEHF